MRKINLAKKIFIGLLLFFVIYNTYFGWNMYPVNEYEVNCDNIFKYGMRLGFIIYFLPVLDLYELIVKAYVK